MRPLLIFTHVPKTAGTSFLFSVVAPHYAEHELYNGVTLKAFPLKLRPRHRVAIGHVAYGLHRFTYRPCTYFTFLRDPIERAVSHYHFIKGCRYHTVKHLAHAYPMAEFYRMRRFQNEMTRMLAGVGLSRLYSYTTGPRIESRVLDAARRHLEKRYVVFGIKERYEESVGLFRARFGWEKRETVEAMKITRERPALSDLDEETITTLHETHRLDSQLYAFAAELFEDRLTTLLRHGQTGFHSGHMPTPHSHSASTSPGRSV